MISFKRLGTKGRLGNQLFQYAFLRFAARRLKVQFYCPTWIGDKIFQLNDGLERSITETPTTKKYIEPYQNCGFHEDVLQISDGTDIEGFFQSEKYFIDKNEVLRWYSFRSELISKVQEKYRFVDFTQATSLSLRIGDDYIAHRNIYPLYPISYYIKSLQMLERRKYLLIFSDRIDRAKEYFKKLKGENIIFMEDNSEVEQLYLMTLCQNNIITNSSFAWWGAWLNPRPDKTVIAPREWLRPGYCVKIQNLIPEGWETIPAARSIPDHFIFWDFNSYFRQYYQMFTKLVRSL